MRTRTRTWFGAGCEESKAACIVRYNCETQVAGSTHICTSKRLPPAEASEPLFRSSPGFDPTSKDCGLSPRHGARMAQLSPIFVRPVLGFSVWGLRISDSGCVAACRCRERAVYREASGEEREVGKVDLQEFLEVVWPKVSRQKPVSSTSFEADS